jgi:hypothetical protein
MAGKKKTSKKKKKKAEKPQVEAKNVDTGAKGQANVESVVLIDAPDEEAVPTPPPAIQEERTLKVVDKGRTTYYTQSEYDKKFGK